MKTDVNIMVVDDSFVDLTLIRRAFETVTPRTPVTYCEDGQDALKAIFSPAKSDTRPTICLLDIKMPLISGLDVLKKIKADETTRDIAVYMLSSSDSPADIRKSYNFGCNGYFQKPRRRQDLELMIESLSNLWEGPARFPKPTHGANSTSK